MKIIVILLLSVAFLSLFLVGCKPTPVPDAAIEVCKERKGWPKYSSTGGYVMFDCLEKEPVVK